MEMIERREYSCNLVFLRHEFSDFVEGRPVIHVSICINNAHITPFFSVALKSQSLIIGLNVLAVFAFFF